MDPESQRLALELLAVDYALSRSYAELTDFELAMALNQQELESTLQSTRPQQRSNLAQDFTAEEQQLLSDRELALRLSNANLPWDDSDNKPTPRPPTPLDSELLRRLEALNWAFDREPGATGESSSQAAARGPARGRHGEPVETRPCASCADDQVAANLTRCPCAHEYCRECFNRMFEMATTDESMFPPRCCQRPIPLDDHLDVLASGLVRRYREKAREYSIQDRTYCHAPQCSAFIPPERIANNVATCPRCREETCALCKREMHDGADCPNDEATQRVLRVAREQGWQQCPRCNRLVEKRSGCNHISRLRLPLLTPGQFEISYPIQRASVWRTCTCPLFTEESLLEREPLPERPFQDAGYEFFGMRNHRENERPQEPPEQRRFSVVHDEDFQPRAIPDPLRAERSPPRNPDMAPRAGPSTQTIPLPVRAVRALANEPQWGRDRGIYDTPSYYGQRTPPHRSGTREGYYSRPLFLDDPANHHHNRGFEYYSREDELGVYRCSWCDMAIDPRRWFPRR
ncbi:hypothetical protein HIM_02222 [Hirsutella minnesotensis 3608]|nr:hypothetical protein HIM_02222 [Hirsutella minnesotensis 3608]